MPTMGFTRLPQKDAAPVNPSPVMQKESKAKLKNLIIAFVAAIALSAAQIWIAISFSKKIIWQSYIMFLAVDSWTDTWL